MIFNPRHTATRTRAHRLPVMGAAICKGGCREAAEPENYDMRVTFRLQGRRDRGHHL